MRRTPSGLKRIAGTWRADRHRREPQPKLGAPRPSRALPAEVAREYRKVLRRLAPCRVLADTDALGIELLALALAEVWRHEAVLREKGYTYETTTAQGSTLIRPRAEVALLADAYRRAVALMVRFGLTPADRGRLTAEDPPERDRLAVYQGARRAHHEAARK